MIERLEAHRLEDHALRMAALELGETFAHMPSKDRVYFAAIRDLLAQKPFLFRENGYSLNDVRFKDFEHNRRHKLVKCKAYYLGVEKWKSGEVEKLNGGVT